MVYTITIEELIKRPIIRDDKPEEFLNKMTDDEINQWGKEVEENLLASGVPKQYPDWNAAYISKMIDMGILYKLFKIQ